MPEEKDLFQYYDENFYESKGMNFSLRDRFINGMQFYAMKQSIRRLFGSKPIKILDYGSGQGQQMAYLKSLGHDVEGCEISKSGRDISKKKYGFDIHVVNDQFFTNNVEKYDLVILSHVLEHLPKPFHYLNKLNNIIASNGYFAVDVPNINSWEASLYKSIYIHLDIPRHVHHYSKKSLTILMNKNGFYVDSLSGLYAIQFPVSGLTSLQNYLKFQGNYTKLLNFFILILLPLQITFSLFMNNFSKEKICIGGFFKKNK
jgi:2-polyprenyl-3-methyl-5-hydroxy-6-metoxy-1,4-benzoquinol methylase